MEYFRQRFINELNEEGEIVIRGNVWSRETVLSKMDKEAADNAFAGWVNDAKVEAKDRCREFLVETGSLRRFQTLSNRVAKGNVIPLIGAGMSVASLSSDRTVQALQAIRAAAQVEPTRHYAFLPWPASSRRSGRAAELAEAEIYPIYYPADQHDPYIENLLVTLMEGGLDD